MLIGAVWSLALALCVLALQEALLTTHDTTVHPVVAENYDHGLFTPLESLSRVSERDFTILGHPFFPKYSVRIKKSKFCDTRVNAYTGYIDTEARHLFFYFFESRSDPAQDDVILWTNGGPGCSSSLGLFMELGPCRIVEPGGPKFHEESWNSNANIFFIDQPIGVGFSYAEYGETVSTTGEAAKDIAAFVSIFFENFSQFKGRAFHLAGESYGGRYIPLFASAVYDQNAMLLAAGLTPVNLSSIMIGNGMTDAFKILLSYWDMSCTAASVKPVLPIETCIAMKRTLSRCEKWMKSSCLDSFDAINCGAAYDFCSDVMVGPFLARGLNPYDITIPCNGSMDTTLCYPQTAYINEYLSKQSTRSLLGVDKSVPANFTSCNYDVLGAFRANLDVLHQTSDYIAALLERNIRVLIYVGENDWSSNWIGNERWTLSLEWTGRQEFVNQPLREWKFHGQVAGKTRKAGNFTFATIRAAGHFVPFDKPAQSLKMLKSWLAGDDL